MATLLPEAIDDLVNFCFDNIRYGKRIGNRNWARSLNKKLRDSAKSCSGGTPIAFLKDEKKTPVYVYPIPPKSSKQYYLVAVPNGNVLEGRRVFNSYNYDWLEYILTDRGNGALNADPNMKHPIIRDNVTHNLVDYVRSGKYKEMDESSFMYPIVFRVKACYESHRRVSLRLRETLMRHGYRLCECRNG